MTITYELDLNSFKAWSGAIDTLDRIKREGKCEELESILEDTYPDGMTETELNDLLWFEADEVYSWLGLRTESEIQGEMNVLVSLTGNVKNSGMKITKNPMMIYKKR